jgi:hypothetical protein
MVAGEQFFSIDRYERYWDRKSSIFTPFFLFYLCRAGKIRSDGA